MKTRYLLALGAALLVTVPFASTALATHHVVVDNDLAQCPNAHFTTIQAAVLAADPGTRIDVCEGTYAEAVTIATSAKDGLKLQARGHLGDVVLEGGSTLGDGFTLSGVSDVEIDGFWVQHYTDAGILVLNSGSGNVIRHNAATSNVGGALPNANGIRNEGTPGTVIEHNLVRENGHHGLLVTGTGSTNVLLERNDVLPNGTLNDDDGIRLHNGAHGNTVSHNRAERTVTTASTSRPRRRPALPAPTTTWWSTIACSTTGRPASATAAAWTSTEGRPTTRFDTTTPKATTTRGFAC